MARPASWSRIAVTAALFGAVAVTSVFTARGNGIASQGPAVANGPLGGNETDGTLDLPFDAGNFTNGRVTAAALQPDGRLLISGPFNKVHGVTRHSIARLNSDGTLDLSFDPGDGLQSGAKGMIVQPDGKIIIYGFFVTVNGVNRAARIARLNSDGSLDTSFNPGRGISLDGADDGSGGATNPGTVNSAVLQPDGKIVVVGQFYRIITAPGTSVLRQCVARFHSDGSFDPSFDPGVGFSHDLGSAVATNAVRQNLGMNSGKITIQGDFTGFDDQFGVDGLVRLNADGSYDDTIDNGTSTDPSSISGLFVQSNDQIVIFGSFASFRGVACSGIIRLNSFGEVDVGFGTGEFDNYGESSTIVSVAQQPNGKLLVAGFFHSLDGMVANNMVRLEFSGARDAGFDPTSAGPSATDVSVVLVRPADSKIFAGGYFSTFGGAPRNNMAWVNDDGTVDGTFNGLSGATDAFPQIFALATQADGKILVGGFFSSFNGSPRYNIVRLNPDATIDQTFDAALETHGLVRALLVQPDGKIVIAGVIRAVNGIRHGRIARLNSDGTLDASFDAGTGADNSIYALAQDSAGSIFVAGNFLSFNGVSRGRVAKLTPTGAVDPAFDQSAGVGAHDGVYAITPPDAAGRIVIGGAFIGYGSQSARRIARLNATTGAFDHGFAASGGTGFNNLVRAVVLAPDGRYYAGGLFSMFNGVGRSRVARLNSDGSLDLTFVGPTTGGIVEALALQNGKIFVGGSFSSPPGRLVRLTDSGALDSTFVTGTGIAISPVNSYVPGLTTVSALAIQGDGNLLVGGLFNKYNGITRVCLARLTTTPTGAPGALANIATRLRVETGDSVLIGGSIVTGTQPKRIIVRAIGPSLPLAGALADPTLELRDSSGGLIASNDNWRTGGQEAEIIATTIPPSNDLESAIVATLPANGSAYTAIVRGVNNGTGIGVVEAYDLDQTANSKLGNISTRGFVQTGDDILIGGLIVLGQTPLRVIARAIGPSLPLSGGLEDPTLSLHDANGALIASNDNWRTGPDRRQRSSLRAFRPTTIWSRQ